VLSTPFRLVVLGLLAAGIACGDSSPDGAQVGQGGSGTGIGGGSDAGFGGEGGLSGGQAGGGSLVEEGGASGGGNCQPVTCEALGKNCGPVADGCGATIDCGSCGAGQSCGLVETNLCTSFEELCEPALAEEVCADKQCGTDGDGCGGTIDCGTCATGSACGLEEPFQCATILVGTDTSCPALITDCGSATCGVIGNGCGGTIPCGTCDPGELCGLFAPNVCGAAPVCQPLAADVACAGKCGLASDGCGETINCQVEFPCPSGETCGGGGVANQCGAVADATCAPILQAAACGTAECGAAGDGCGGSYTCGSGCDVGSACRLGQCDAAPVCTPSTELAACSGKTCGQVGDGCGGTHDCGDCTGGQECGVQVAFQCGTPQPDVCEPSSRNEACAGKECGTAFDGCGTALINRFTCGSGCADGEFCGLETPFQCDAPVIPPCVAEADEDSCLELGWACGQAINRCGEVFDCADDGLECSAFQICTGGITGPTTCTGDPADCELCTAVPICPVNSPTRLTGRVITPGRTDLIGELANRVGVPNAFVYILRNNDVGDLPDIGTGIPDGGTSCDRCSDQDLGPVLTSAITDSSGEFTLEGNIPFGEDFLLVTKVGKFRRAEVVPALAVGNKCTTIALTETMPGNPTRLPRAMNDGLAVNIPRIAISTGQIDAMECVFAKMGIAANQFTRPQLGGPIHLYRANGAWPDQQSFDCNACGGGAGTTPDACRTTNCGGASTAARTSFLAAVSDANLHDTLPSLSAYDTVVYDCEGLGWDSTFAQRGTPGTGSNGDRLREYVNRGGRMFASHLSFSWLHQNGTTPYAALTPFDTGLGNAATWNTTLYTDSSGTGQVSLGRTRASPRIQSFADWMTNEGLTNGSNQFTITDPRSMVFDTDQTRLGAASEEFVFRQDSPDTDQTGDGRVQQFSFNTPYAAPLEDSCGRVAYSGFHVAATGGGSSPFLNSVFPAHCAGTLTAQEKVLLFMLFDLGACVGAEPEPPPCVPEACPTDGTCGVLGDGCGGNQDCGCDSGEVCIANQCEVPDCVPTTCADEGIICSSISNGCGAVLECDCPLCEPLSEEAACALVECGTASDGCSAVYECPEECSAACIPITACPSNLECGLISDGCDGTLNCGPCPSGELCGSGGPNVCGVPQCQPLECADLDATCGLIGNGCGGSVDCGDCPPGQSCTIAGGIPNTCAGCIPGTCEDVGAECGLIGDGCGGTVQCGPCPTGQICGAQEPNQCGSGPQCPPQTCLGVGANCGVIGDGCGGQVDCGVCPVGKLCGINSPFQCGDAPVCTPATCASANAQCGSIGDGCGGLVECGDCAPGLTCGLGQANTCGQIR
jgi:hypothetical protein